MDCSPQALLSMGFSRQEYWSELPLPSPGDLPDPGVEPRSPALQVDTLPLSHQGSPLELFLTLTSSLLGISSKKKIIWGVDKDFCTKISSVALFIFVYYEEFQANIRETSTTKLCISITQIYQFTALFASTKFSPIKKCSIILKQSQIPCNKPTYLYLNLLNISLKNMGLLLHNLKARITPNPCKSKWILPNP